MRSKRHSISNDPAQESAVFVTAEDVAAGGVIGKECSVSMSTNDETSAVGDVRMGTQRPVLDRPEPRGATWIIQVRSPCRRAAERCRGERPCR